MNIRRLIVVSLGCALIILPLAAIAYAPTHYLVSGVVNGNCTASVTDINPATGRKVTTKHTFANGVVDPQVVLGVDNDARKADIDELTVRFGTGQDAQNDAVAFILANFLQSGKSSGSGPGEVEIDFPSMNYISTHAGKFRQWEIDGSIKGNIAIKVVNDVPVRAVFKTGKVTVSFVSFVNYSSDGAGTVTEIGRSGDEPFDGAITMPAMNLELTAL